MKKILQVLILLMSLQSISQATLSWRSEATNGNWNDANNWWNGSGTQSPAGSEILRFGNNNQTTMANNAVNTNRYQIFFDPSATSSRTITGSVINTFYDFGGNKPKIENSSTATHTINFPIALGNFTTEINPVNGNLVFARAVNLQSNYLDIFGNNGKSATFNGVISGSGGVTIKENSTVVYTAANTYTGLTTVTAGTLQIGNGSGTGSVTSNIVNNSAVVFNRSGVITSNIVMSGTGTCTKQGSSSLTFAQDQTYSGATVLNSGTLVLGVNIANSTITVNTGATLIITGNNVIVKGLTVNSGGIVVVQPGKSLTLNENLVVNGTGSLTLESNSTTFASLLVNGSSTGTIRYKRHVNVNSSTGGNDLIASPVTDQNFGDFSTLNPNIVSDPNNANRKLFGPFDKPTGTFLVYNSVTDAATLIEPGVGYRAASSDLGTFTFSGALTSGTISRAISVSGPQFEKWNLVGNPYSTYLYVQEQTGVGAHDGFLNTNALQLDPSYVSIYGYDNDSSDGSIYTIWNLANTTPSTMITPGQGFFVVSKPGGGTVSFTPGMRGVGTSDDFILGRNTATDSNNAFLKLNISNDVQNYRTDFYFNEVSTLGLDPGYDAGVFGSGAPSFSVFSRLVENNIGIDMQIQSLPYSSLGSEVIIPLGMKAPQGQQITVSISESTIPTDIEVYLEDTITGISTLLNTNDYVFSPTTNLTGIGRFNLRFTNTVLSSNSPQLQQIKVFVSQSTKTLSVIGLLVEDTLVSLYDIQGRLVSNSILEKSSNENRLNISNLSSGVYVVKLSNSQQQKTQKIVIK